MEQTNEAGCSGTHPTPERSNHNDEDLTMIEKTRGMKLANTATTAATAAAAARNRSAAKNFNLGRRIRFHFDSESTDDDENVDSHIDDMSTQKPKTVTKVNDILEREFEAEVDKILNRQEEIKEILDNETDNEEDISMSDEGIDSSDSDPEVTFASDTLDETESMSECLNSADEGNSLSISYLFEDEEVKRYVTKIILEKLKTRFKHYLGPCHSLKMEDIQIIHPLEYWAVFEGRLNMVCLFIIINN